ncbi:MAG: hypothetical protein KIT87_00240 [Anaerolineae bacterium]|nr:hypothetical protein [Anaerolineae bacterium]
MSEEFISEPIEVEYSQERMMPTAFVWRGDRYTVAEVLQEWQDWGIPNYAHVHGWIHRRHRNYYVVRTTDEKVFELYLDRPPKRREWILLKRRA